VYAGSAFPVLPITTDYSVAKCFCKAWTLKWCLSRNSLDQAIKLSSTYFDDKSKTSKLLILISDGEDHSEGAQAAAEEANKQGMRIIRFRNRKGGTIPLKKNGVVQSYQRDNNDEVVVTKLNRA
jgi:Ca-activated chloride channel family protein